MHEFPARQAFGHAEHDLLTSYLETCLAAGIDPGYEGPMTSAFAAEFSEWMGGGHALPVSSGTAGLLVALQVLRLPRGGEVLVSPIADPGVISAIIYAGLTPTLFDVDRWDCVANFVTIEARITPRTVAVLLIHSFGKAADVQAVANLCESRGLALLEDCSQAHGAQTSGKLVGNFGHVSVFSTMFTKTLQSGGSGGIVFTREHELFNGVVALADRGKPKWQSDYDPRDPRSFLYPALNFNGSDIASAIGLASLRRLDSTVEKRRNVYLALKQEESHFAPLQILDLGEHPSPFVIPVLCPSGFPRARANVSALLTENGIPHNPHYFYIPAQWPWATDKLGDTFLPSNAIELLDHSVILYVNENYGEAEVSAISESLSAAANLFKV